VTTVVFQWIIFFVMFTATYRERTGLYGIGFKPLRAFDLVSGLAFFAAAALTMSGLAILMERIGYPLPGEIAMLIPTDAFGRVVWVAVSLTAGICEEALFRGYLMTRLRVLMKTDSWLWPLIISSVFFGMAHGYQGPNGMILLSVYGLILGGIFIYTKSLWPVIVVHALQDLMALFFPQ
jgi:membrane protease YdiL (CAAX protease family)